MLFRKKTEMFSERLFWQHKIVLDNFLISYLALIVYLILLNYLFFRYNHNKSVHTILRNAHNSSFKNYVRTFHFFAQTINRSTHLSARLC